MAVVLLQALERTELNKLPKGIQNKLEKFVTELQNANEVLQTQHERFKADSGGYLEQVRIVSYLAFNLLLLLARFQYSSILVFRVLTLFGYKTCCMCFATLTPAR